MMSSRSSYIPSSPRATFRCCARNRSGAAVQCANTRRPRQLTCTTHRHLERFLLEQLLADADEGGQFTAVYKRGEEWVAPWRNEVESVGFRAGCVLSLPDADDEDDDEEEDEEETEDDDDKPELPSDKGDINSTASHRVQGTKSVRFALPSRSELRAAVDAISSRLDSSSISSPYGFSPPSTPPTSDAVRFGESGQPRHLTAPHLPASPKRRPSADSSGSGGSRSSAISGHSSVLGIRQHALSVYLDGERGGT